MEATHGPADLEGAEGNRKTGGCQKQVCSREPRLGSDMGHKAKGVFPFYQAELMVIDLCNL